MSRNIVFTKERNFRDLGLNTPIQEKLLLRGESTYGFNKKDLTILKNDYHLSKIIDLRTAEEAKEKPDAEMAGVEYIHSSIYNEAQLGITHESTSMFWKDPKAILPNMVELYRRFARAEMLDNFSSTMKLIMKHDPTKGSILFHCTAGKDRTGIIAYLIYHMFNIDEEHIYEDYLYSNRIAGKKARLLSLFVLPLKGKEIADVVYDVYTVKKENLDAYLDEISKIWGNVDNYLEKGLKISEEEIVQFKKKYEK